MGSSLIVSSSEDTNFNYIPKDYEISDHMDYFHVTSNNTIFQLKLKSFTREMSP